MAPPPLQRFQASLDYSLFGSVGLETDQLNLGNVAGNIDTRTEANISAILDGHHWNVSVALTENGVNTNYRNRVHIDQLPTDLRQTLMNFRFSSQQTGGNNDDTNNNNNNRNRYDSDSSNDSDSSSNSSSSFNSSSTESNIEHVGPLHARALHMRQLGNKKKICNHGQYDRNFCSKCHIRKRHTSRWWYRHYSRK